MTATDKLAGIKPGDRVRVTFEATAGQTTDVALLMQLDGAKAYARFVFNEINAPTFHIERLEKPLEVGDRVRLSDARARGMAEAHGRVIAVAPNYAWVEWPLGGAPRTHILPDLERIA